MLLLIDGRTVESESLQFQRGQQVMIWIRDLEKLGWGTVESAQSAQISFKGKGVTLKFGKSQGVALVNSLAVRLPIDTYMRDGKLMVPLSFVARALGYDYECSYKAVATVSTAPVRPTKDGNSIRGTVLYNGRPAAGIVVRAVDEHFALIKDSVANTDTDGAFSIDGLPDGSYMAYVYTGDNPGYFNRTSEVLSVKGGQVADLKPISLGRIITGLSPKPGERRDVQAKGNAEFSWTPCEGAASYRVTITNRRTAGIVFETTTEEPETAVPFSRFVYGTLYEAQVTATNAAGEFLGGTPGAGGMPWTFTFERR